MPKCGIWLFLPGVPNINCTSHFYEKKWRLITSANFEGTKFQSLWNGKQYEKNEVDTPLKKKKKKQKTLFLIGLGKWI